MTKTDRNTVDSSVENMNVWNGTISTTNAEDGYVTVEKLTIQDEGSQCETLPTSTSAQESEEDELETDLETNDAQQPAPIVVIDTTDSVPNGPRWAICDSSIDLTGKWIVVTNSEWKKSYDVYLQALGISRIKRKLASSFISLLKEEVEQSEDGKEMLFRSINPKGSWERTFISSGALVESDDFQELHVDMKTGSGDYVKGESWWEQNGSVHHSWSRGAPTGDYEALRYMEKDNNTGEEFYVCESYFYKRDSNGIVSSTNSAMITWRFRRDGS